MGKKTHLFITHGTTKHVYAVNVISQFMHDPRELY